MKVDPVSHALPRKYYTLEKMEDTLEKIGKNRGITHPIVRSMYVCIQGNLRTRDTLGLIVLSLVERLSLSQRKNNTLKY